MGYVALEIPGRSVLIGRFAKRHDASLAYPHFLKAHIPAYPVSGPIDICGAGDSCSAGIASAMVSGATHEQAAAFGNLVASITIQQIGVTGTATPAQVRARWREVQPRV